MATCQLTANTRPSFLFSTPQVAWQALKAAKPSRRRRLWFKKIGQKGSYTEDEVLEAVYKTGDTALKDTFDFA